MTQLNKKNENLAQLYGHIEAKQLMIITMQT